MLRKLFILGSAALLLAGAVGPLAAADPVRSVTAITEVYGDGQKVGAVALEYTGSVDTARLTAADFAVEGATVGRVYANTSAAKTDRGTNGPFVIVELVNTVQPAVMAGPPAGEAPGASGPPAGGGPQLGDRAVAGPAKVPLSAQVTQKKPVALVGGTVVPAGGSWKTGRTVNLVVDDFVPLVYNDPKYPGQPLMYNLYLPKGYDPAKKYPLVLFMHDAGVVSLNPTETLTQGNGATAFASPAAQAKNPAFVLAPQYDRVIVGDGSQTAVQLDITVDLLRSLTAHYSIDTNRLYNTGQSMGGMTSIAMDVKYPGLFAASLLVACQWDPAVVAPLAKMPLWIVVSEGDTKAKPGQDAILAALKPLGATVDQTQWSAEAPADQRARAVADQAASDTSIHYTVFTGGNHRYTWEYAYGNDGFREWLFSQVKTSSLSAAELAARGEAFAAGRADVTAHYYLGYLAENGIARSQSYAEAVAFYAQAAPATGHAEGIACSALGRLYENGLGVAKDPAKALAWYRRGAELQDAASLAAVKRLGGS